MKLGMLLDKEAIIATNCHAWEAVEVEHLALNSQKLEQGGAFFALLPAGQSFATSKDRFFLHLEQALARKAKVIILDQKLEEILKNFPYSGKYSTDTTCFIEVNNARQQLARAARYFYGRLPSVIVAVTGTSGKSSVVNFLQQIWQAQGLKTASIGTLGICSEGGSRYTGLTTPDVLSLYEALSNLAQEGITHLAIEASSHGIEQHRLDYLPLKAAAFTNMGRDHLDYHGDMENYFAAKCRLFETLLPKSAPAILCADDHYLQKLARQRNQKGEVTWLVGKEGDFIKLETITQRQEGQELAFFLRGKYHRLVLPLAGKFQASNALLACALAIASGQEESNILAQLSSLKGVKGRLELVAKKAPDISIYVDYAHKPEALQNVLTTAKSFTKNRLIVIFGCGGDRDKGKRPIMGEIAQNIADIIIITDDNPRFESPQAIRNQILAGASSAIEIPNRYEAIKKGISLATSGDTVIIAGKGHETGQIIGEDVIPFCDNEAIIQALKEIRE